MQIIGGTPARIPNGTTARIPDEKCRIGSLLKYTSIKTKKKIPLKLGTPTEIFGDTRRGNPVGIPGGTRNGTSGETLGRITAKSPGGAARAIIGGTSCEPLGRTPTRIAGGTHRVFQRQEDHKNYLI